MNNSYSNGNDQKPPSFKFGGTWYLLQSLEERYQEATLWRAVKVENDPGGSVDYKKIHQQIADLPADVQFPLQPLGTAVILCIADPKTDLKAVYKALEKPLTGFVAVPDEYTPIILIIDQDSPDLPALQERLSQPEPSPTPEDTSVETDQAPSAPEDELAVIAKKEAIEQQPEGKQPVLLLDEHAYVLIAADTTGTTAVVWQARKLKLSEPLVRERYERLTPSESTRTQLTKEFVDQTFPDPEDGELVAVKLARPGKQNEQALEKERQALHRLGDSVLPVHYPAEREQWPPDFPCLVMAWVKGQKLSEWGAFSESDGLEVAHQLAKILVTIRMLAPDIIPTDSLKAGSIFVHQDEQGSYDVQLIDWNVYAQNEGAIRESTLLRFGEVMLDILAPAMNFKIDRATNTAPVESLGAGERDDTGIQQWDGLSWGSREIIRRCLRRDFDGDASTIVRALRDVIEAQINHWKEPNPLAKAEQADGIARLNWLDIARSRGEQIDVQEVAPALWDLLDGYGHKGRHLEARIALRTAMRRFPRESVYRWAMMVHTIARKTNLPAAYQRLGLGDALDHLRAGNYRQAQARLEKARTMLPEDEQKPFLDRLLRALAHRAIILETVPRALNALKDDWDVDAAESALEKVKAYQQEARDGEKQLLTGPDRVCQESSQTLERAVRAFYQEHPEYQQGVIPFPDLLAQTRQEKFAALIKRAKQFEQKAEEDDSLDLRQAALDLYQRAAVLYPTLWQENFDLEQKRQALAAQLNKNYVEDSLIQAKEAINTQDFNLAMRYISQALRSTPDNDEAISLQAGLLDVQQGRVAKNRGDFRTAQAAFEKASIIDELKDLAQEEIKELRKDAQLAEKIDKTIQELAIATETLKQTRRDQDGEITSLADALREYKPTGLEAKELLEKTDPDHFPNRQTLQANYTAFLQTWREGHERLRRLVEAALKEAPDLQSLQILQADLHDTGSSLSHSLAALYAYRQALEELERSQPAYGQVKQHWQKGETRRRGLSEGDSYVEAARHGVVEAVRKRLEQIWGQVYERVMETGRIAASLEAALEQVQAAPPQGESLGSLGQNTLDIKSTEADVRTAIMLLGESESEQNRREVVQTLASSQISLIAAAVEDLKRWKQKVAAALQPSGLKTLAARKKHVDINQAIEAFWNELFRNVTFDSFDKDPARIALAVKDQWKQPEDANTLIRWTLQQSIVGVREDLALEKTDRLDLLDDHSTRPEGLFYMAMRGFTPSVEQFQAVARAMTGIKPATEREEKKGWFNWFAIGGSFAIASIFFLLGGIIGFGTGYLVWGRRDSSTTTPPIEITQTTTLESPTVSETKATPVETEEATPPPTDTPVPATGSVSGRLYYDTNLSGAWENEMDEPISGLEVIIKNESDEEVDRVSSDENGFWKAEAIPVGKISIEVDESNDAYPSGYAPTGTGQAELDVSTDQEISAGKYGFIPPLGTVTGVLYEDRDTNDAMDEGEAIPNKDLTLTFEDEQKKISFTVSDTTDETGKWQVKAPIGENRLDVPGYIPTATENAEDHKIIIEAETDLAHLGFVPNSGRLYLDLDENGQYDPDIDRGLPNIKLIVTHPNNKKHEYRTNTDGTWLVEVSPGEVTVEVAGHDKYLTPISQEITHPFTATVAENENVLVGNVGYKPNFTCVTKNEYNVDPLSFNEGDEVMIISEESGGHFQYIISGEEGFNTLGTGNFDKACFEDDSKQPAQDSSNTDSETSPAPTETVSSDRGDGQGE